MNALLVLVAVFAQFNAPEFASGLRAKYGPALHREVFIVPAGEMVVDYATSGNVCRIQLPPIGPVEGRPRVRSPQGMDEFILGLVPLSLRGKELNRFTETMGLSSISIIQYEKVNISETLTGRKRTGINVTFTQDPCLD